MRVLSTVVISVVTLWLAQTFSTPPENPTSFRAERATPAKSQHSDTNDALVFARLSPSWSRASQPRQLSLADRVAYQRAIEEVYWRHRIWPKERPDPKPSLQEVTTSAQLQKRVEDYLRNSAALEDYWGQPLTAEQLQAEMERMAQHTKQPEVLRELFEALGNDPFVIAECLARPALSERLVTNFYAHDQRFHGELKRRVEADLRAHRSVRQMKQTSGNYSEIELVRNDDEEIVGQAPRLPKEQLAGGAPAIQRQDSTADVKLNSREWDQTVQKLAAMFGGGQGVAAGISPAKAAPTAQIKTGLLSPLQEDEDRYYATAVINKSKNRVKLATVEWPKEPLEFWRSRAEDQTPKLTAAVPANHTLPAISGGVGGCYDEAWAAASTTSAPSARFVHTAVWTGSEMIVWGGNNGPSYLNTGGRYTPGTDSWTATSTTNAPSGRWVHTAVWTGSEMIVWGGDSGTADLNTGGRYNPSTNSWTATTTTNAPSARNSHRAVWTGSEMIVWGGDFSLVELNTGGRYNPSTNSWIATSTTNAPSARASHTAVWTGSEMIVWGGIDPSSNYVNSGGRYNPSTNSWTATSTTNAPTGRTLHTAVWSGSEMIVWGGLSASGRLNSGGRYNPGTDSWTATSATNAPVARDTHTEVWTGSEMIVWGGLDSSFNYLNTGGRYNPGTDSWTATSTSNAPSERQWHTAVWTGSEMIIWGGSNGSVLNTGGRYAPSPDWTATSVTSAPSARFAHTAVWTGSEVIVWGGLDSSSNYLNTGARYNPGTDSWIATSISNPTPSARFAHTAVWTGSEMVVWGGQNASGLLNTGGRYNPGANTWTATSTSNAPSARFAHTTVWSGSEMIVWAGYNGAYLNTGGRYNPDTNSWTATSTTNAPSVRTGHTAVWSDSEMIVWGGLISPPVSYLNTGGRYNPSTNSWTATTTTNAPDARYLHTAVWSGSEMIVWGGTNGSYLNTGARYTPGNDSWTATSTTNVPSVRTGHTAVWSGSEMIVWGGYDGSYLNSGGRYNPGNESWIVTSSTIAPSARTGHTAIWSGSEMIVWGGDAGTSYFNTGGRYCVQAPMAQSASSRKTHGAAGTFDIPLPLTGDVGIECRSGGATMRYQMIVNFITTVTVESASVTSGTGSVSSFNVSGSQVTVNLTGITDVQIITVTLFDVNDGTHVGDVPVSVGVLVGDVNGDSTVDTADVTLTRSQVGLPVTGSNFREDVKADGTINTTDVRRVRSNLGHSLP